jgi:glucans biosynthesis protein
MFKDDLRSTHDAEEPRCGARLRRGGTCALPPAAGKRRCFQHGGARGIGAPRGSRNAWKHGFYSAEQTAQRLRINAFFRDCLRTMREIEASWTEEGDDSRTA